MWIMTGTALAILDRLMLRQGFILTSDGILVATAANGNHISLDKPFLLSGVGIMAAQTPLFRQDRPVEPVPGQHCIHKIAMTTAT